MITDQRTALGKRSSKCQVFDRATSGEVDLRRDTVERLIATGEFFWLDLYRPDTADFEILRDVFKFHPLAVEDSEYFDQRAKIDDYDDFVFIVVYGASPDRDRLVELVGMRKAVTPQRDAFASLTGRMAELPGFHREDEHYFRDTYDHLIRISDLIDSYRDLLTGAMDVYLSTVSNRLNAVMKQLTIIATVFLPLTFIAGFFGQNFGWMTGHIHHWGTFVGLGLGTELLALLLLVGFFKRRGWF